MKVVVKIGSSSLTRDDGGIHQDAISQLCRDVATLAVAGHQPIIVSSGAVAAGVQAVGLSERPTDLETLQAVSAVGQSRLMGVYDDELASHGLVGAQVLLDPLDFVHRSQYLHARKTLERLLALKCVPVINENDAIASSELRYGDNDRIAALIAHSVNADLLVLLTDLDGLYTADPRVTAGATLVDTVAADDPLLSIQASTSKSAVGSGGMASKLVAARIASWSGVRTVIASADRAGAVSAIVGGERLGTTFEAHQRTLTARKLWIAFAAETAGRITVDDGAWAALTTKNTSLLPAGVTGVDGAFVSGATVEIAAANGTIFARGMTAMSAAELHQVIGLQTSALPQGMHHEVVHRDDLVVLPG
jgi:glutamate 5-kinase